MSPRTRSLSTRRDLDRVFRTGRRVRRDGVQVVVSPRDVSAAPTRTAVSVRASRAVVRNRARRRVVHALREIGPVAGWDVIVRCGSGAASMPWEELETNLRDALTEAGAAPQVSE